MTGPASAPLLFGSAAAPSHRSHRVAFAAGMACTGAAFAALAVLAHGVPYFAIDLTITRQIQAIQAGWFDRVLLPLNVIGFPPLVGILYGTITLLILAAGARWEAAACGFATLGAAGLNTLVKDLVARPRPSPDLIHVAHQLPGYGFPAGHVLNMTAFVGFLCYLTVARLAPSWPRTALIVLLVAMMVVMGIARIDAGEHWPSDVLGGYVLGFLWLATTVEFYRWGRRRAVRLGGDHSERRREAQGTGTPGR